MSGGSAARGAPRVRLPQLGAPAEWQATRTRCAARLAAQECERQRARVVYITVHSVRDLGRSTAHGFRCRSRREVDALRHKLLQVRHRASKLEAVIEAARKKWLDLRRVQAEFVHNLLARTGDKLPVGQGRREREDSWPTASPTPGRASALTMTGRALRLGSVSGCTRTCAMSRRRASTLTTGATSCAAVSDRSTTSAHGLPESTRTRECEWRLTTSATRRNSWSATSESPGGPRQYSVPRVHSACYGRGAGVAA